jgi:HD-GYP domain-containing protein (c-di-GMP phosphodiesterase class II)
MQQDLLVAGLLHDIGFIALPDQLLQRPVAQLGDAELALYRRHPLVGENALMALEDLRPVAALIHAHHERHDGKGFPDGLAGADVPLGARILAVADTFDAVQHGLLVESAASTAQARLLVRHGRGTQFDPEVVDVFLHITEPQQPHAPTSVRLSTAQLQPGMVLAAELVSSQGLLMLTRGQRLSADLIHRIRQFESRDGGQLALQILRAPGEPCEETDPA